MMERERREKRRGRGPLSERLVELVQLFPEGGLDFLSSDISLGSRPWKRLARYNDDHGWIGDTLVEV
jgi:hypothetical protein